MWVFVLVCHVDRMLLVGPVSAAGSRHIRDISLYGESGLSFTFLPFQLIDGYRAIASASLGTQGGPTVHSYQERQGFIYHAGTFIVLVRV